MPKRKAGYESLLNEITETVRNSSAKLDQAVEASEKIIQAASEMTRDELTHISDTMRADLQEFAENYQENKSGPFYTMISNSIWEGLASITDRTALEWIEFSKELERRGTYKAGDIIGLGILTCERCGHKAEYNHPTEIIPCIACGHHLFRRVSLRSGQ
jgi:rubrerythrin